MKKMLSICIPTYNRPDKLENLYKSFLSPALSSYSNFIEVLVCDNSDEYKSLINQSVLGKDVTYHKNSGNLGFDGNLLECMKNATGEFIWIISDDDIILGDGFKHLMKNLPSYSNTTIDCIMLPINYRTIYGEFIETNEEENAKKQGTDFITYVKSMPTVPFGYFSSSVLRLNKKNLEEIEKGFRGNIIINIPLFCSMLSPESRLTFLELPVIEYQERYFVRMDIIKFFEGCESVIRYLERNYDINGKTLIDHTYKESLLMLLSHRTKLRPYLNGDNVRWSLLKKLPQNFSIKSLALSGMIILPGLVAKIPYLLYLSIHYTHSRNELSFKSVTSRFRLLNAFIEEMNMNDRKKKEPHKCNLTTG
jgi:glycosyltransferase involved in cell wall biosynthesis